MILARRRVGDERYAASKLDATAPGQKNMNNLPPGTIPLVVESISTETQYRDFEFGGSRVLG